MAGSDKTITVTIRRSSPYVFGRTHQSSRNYYSHCSLLRSGKQLPLLIVPTDGPSLLGRDWLNEIVLDWKQLNKVHYIRQQELQNVLDQYTELFQPGTLKGMTTKIHVQDNARP